MITTLQVKHNDVFDKSELVIPKDFSFPENWLIGRLGNEKERIFCRWSKTHYCIIGFDLVPVNLDGYSTFSFQETVFNRLIDIIKRK